MACVEDKEHLSPSERKIVASIENNFLSIDDISEKTGLPIFRVRSGIRKLLDNSIIIEKSDTYKVK